MAPTSCANCNTANADSHPLKLCGACKTVGYCNRACQKANWKAHKPSCRQSEVTGLKFKNAKDEQTYRDLTDTIATMVPSAERVAAGEPYGFSSSEIFTIPETSQFIWVPPTPELPLGAHRLVDFDAEFLAEISHLSQEEQEKAKHGFVSEMLATEAAWMTPEMREEQRLEMAAAGRLQAELAVKLDAKKARDAESK